MISAPQCFRELYVIVFDNRKNFILIAINIFNREKSQLLLTWKRCPPVIICSGFSTTENKPENKLWINYV